MAFRLRFRWRSAGQKLSCFRECRPGAPLTRAFFGRAAYCAPAAHGGGRPLSGSAGNVLAERRIPADRSRAAALAAMMTALRQDGGARGFSEGRGEERDPARVVNSENQTTFCFAPLKPRLSGDWIALCVRALLRALNGGRRRWRRLYARSPKECRCFREKREKPQSGEEKAKKNGKSFQKRLPTCKSMVYYR